MRIDTVLKFLAREAVAKGTFFLPEESRRRIERRMRGREEIRYLREADRVIVSYGKSGRTWLRVMLSRFYQVRYGLPQEMLLSFDNFHRRNPAIPKILFTHDNYIADYTGNRTTKADFRDKPVVLLVRNPADVAVSLYFQWRYRMLPRKKMINRYPPHGADVSVFDFVMNEEAGLKAIVTFLNQWAGALSQLDQVHIVRYEDMRARPEAELGAVLTFMGAEPREEEIAEAVAFASFENMKKLESGQVFWRAGRRLLPGDKSNPDSFKVRRGKVGGFRDYFDDDQVEQIVSYIDANLDPVFGYNSGGVREETRAADGTSGE